MFYMHWNMDKNFKIEKSGNNFTDSTYLFFKKYCSINLTS